MCLDCGLIQQFISMQGRGNRIEWGTKILSHVRHSQRLGVEGAWNSNQIHFKLIETMKRRGRVNTRAHLLAADGERGMSLLPVILISALVATGIYQSMSYVQHA